MLENTGVCLFASGGIDSQFCALLLRRRRLLVECFNCALVLNQAYRVAELAATLNSLNVSTRMLKAQTVFSSLVVRRTKRDASGQRVVCVVCNDTVKTALCQLLASLLSLASASGHHVRKTLLTQQISNSLQLTKSQAYFTSFDNTAITYPLALLRKNETKRVSPQFGTSASESFGLCHLRQGRRIAAAGPTGCVV